MAGPTPQEPIIEAQRAESNTVESGILSLLNKVFPESETVMRELLQTANEEVPQQAVNKPGVLDFILHPNKTAEAIAEEVLDPFRQSLQQFEDATQQIGQEVERIAHNVEQDPVINNIRDKFAAIEEISEGTPITPEVTLLIENLQAWLGKEKTGEFTPELANEAKEAFNSRKPEQAIPLNGKIDGGLLNLVKGRTALTMIMTVGKSGGRDACEVPENSAMQVFCSSVEEVGLKNPQAPTQTGQEVSGQDTQHGF
nr:hypothetical protein 19 [bacterium]